MDEARVHLVGLGLTQTESAIYLYGVSVGSPSIQDIAAATKVKRPTVYHAIGTLIEKGLVAERRIDGKLRFTMAPPTALKRLIEEQKDSLMRKSAALDELIPQIPVSTGNPKKVESGVVEYKGIDGMKSVMDIALYCKSKEWDIIAPYQNFLREYDPAYAEKYLKARKHYGITSRTLWESGMRDRALTQDELVERNPRLMPEVMRGKFDSMLILFDDKVAIFSSLEKASAVLVTSKETHEIFRAMFDGLWSVSTPY